VVLAALLVIAVGLAFADASVVVLALPDIYREFSTTVVGVSWVLTAYALVVTVAALGVALVARKVRPAWLTASGLVVFAVSSAAAGAAGSFGALLVARCAQGVGAALLLGASVPVLGRLLGSPSRGRSWWAWAATVGAAVGPALGGVLTEVLDWRAIFIVQAPFAAAALAVLAVPVVRRAPAAARAGREPRAWLANLGFVLLFAALVGALFLSVLLVVEVWRFTPIAGAVVVSALPLGTLVARPLGARLGAAVAAIGGGALLAVGLGGLGLLPGAAPWFAAVALAGCGLGFGLLGTVFGPVAIPASADPVRSGSLSTAARHAGIVLGLVVLAPMLATNLGRAADRAVLLGTSTMLDGRIPITEKIPLALDLRDEIEATPVGEVPDLGAVFAEHGAADDAELATVRDDLTGTIEEALTVAFRPAFGVAAGLAVLAVLPALGVAGLVTRRRTRVAAAATLAVLLAGGGLLVRAELGRDAWDRGRYVAADPCTASPDPYPVGGLDGFAQNAALGALNGAACELGVSREELVLSIDPESGFSDVRWDNDRVEEAVRAGLRRSIDDLEERGSLPWLAAAGLGFLADRAPVDWLLDRLGIDTSGTSD
jgi:MFS family permease